MQIETSVNSNKYQKNSYSQTTENGSSSYQQYQNFITQENKKEEQTTTNTSSLTNKEKQAQDDAALAAYQNNQSSKNTIEETEHSSQYQEQQDQISSLRKLVEDIKSVLRTGFTPEELEQLEKLIAEIKKLMDEKDSNNDRDIASKIKKLEEAILALQKKLGGVAIIELEDKNTSNPNKENGDDITVDPLGFQAKLDALQKTLEKIKSGALKNEEQFNTAMDEHGLNPKSEIDVLILELIQQGYSKEVATQRAHLYRDAGLISNHGELEEKFGIKVHHLGFTSFNPAYKQASREAFDKMDLETLKGVVNTIGSSDVFSINIEDAIKIMPRDGSRSHEEVMQGWAEYWDNRYGNKEKMNNLFNSLLEHHNLNQKFSPRDLTYIKEGIVLLQESYNNLDS